MNCKSAVNPSNVDAFPRHLPDVLLYRTTVIAAFENRFLAS